jgi:hypothetical protein
MNLKEMRKAVNEAEPAGAGPDPTGKPATPQADHGRGGGPVRPIPGRRRSLGGGMQAPAACHARREGQGLQGHIRGRWLPFPPQTDVRPRLRMAS